MPLPMQIVYCACGRSSSSSSPKTTCRHRARQANERQRCIQEKMARDLH